MKKQTNPQIKAHLLRSALILVALVAFCLIPFTLAQRQIGAPMPQQHPTGITCTPGWSAGPDLPSAGVRFVGVFFPANGKFYAMGGRDVNNVEFTNPFEYDPVSNSWTTKGATYPDSLVSNTECAVLNDSGTDYIYCVGGSQVSTQTETGRVFRYD